MKIAVINEVSASLRNEDIVKALHKTTDAEILNVGMKTPEQMPSLTYIHTSYMAAILLNTGSCDFVVGGCGTGQGFLNGVLQFPGIVCGLIVEPLDGWLFSQDQWRKLCITSAEQGIWLGSKCECGVYI